MKKTLITLVTLMSMNVYAGGSRYDCTSVDGSVSFSGDQTDSVNVLASIYTNDVKDKNGKILGKSMSVDHNDYTQGKNLPDFGSPQDSNDTIDTVLAEVKTMAKEQADPNNYTKFVLGLGKAKMLESIEESECRDTGNFIFEQNFAVISVKYTPWATALKTHPFSISTSTKKFLCTSSYATTMGGRCQ